MNINIRIIHLSILVMLFAVYACATKQANDTDSDDMCQEKAEIIADYINSRSDSKTFFVNVGPLTRSAIVTKITNANVVINPYGNPTVKDGIIYDKNTHVEGVFIDVKGIHSDEHLADLKKIYDIDNDEVNACIAINITLPLTKAGRQKYFFLKIHNNQKFEIYRAVDLFFD
jgi:hypothetical protein